MKKVILLFLLILLNTSKTNAFPGWQTTKNVLTKVAMGVGCVSIPPVCATYAVANTICAFKALKAQRWLDSAKNMYSAAKAEAGIILFFVLYTMITKGILSPSQLISLFPAKEFVSFLVFYNLIGSTINYLVGEKSIIALQKVLDFFVTSEKNKTTKAFTADLIEGYFEKTPTQLAIGTMKSYLPWHGGTS